MLVRHTIPILPRAKPPAVKAERDSGTQVEVADHWADGHGRDEKGRPVGGHDESSQGGARTELSVEALIGRGKQALGIIIKVGKSVDDLRGDP